MLRTSPNVTLLSGGAGGPLTLPTEQNTQQLPADG
jgi:hypothetical protein